jgi:hypothetical protein
MPLVMKQSLPPPQQQEQQKATPVPVSYWLVLDCNLLCFTLQVHQVGAGAVCSKWQQSRAAAGAGGSNAQPQ